jgi:hypothetical protein
MKLKFAKLIPNYCLIHGVGKYDHITGHRWFSFFGKNPKNFDAALDFSFAYTGNGARKLEFWKVTKPIMLLYIPYFLTFDEENEKDEEAQYKYADELINKIILFVLSSSFTSDGRDTLDQSIQGIFEAVVGKFNVDRLSSELQAVYDGALSRNRKNKVKEENPDLILARIITQMGQKYNFEGWMRVRKLKKITPSDEIFINDIHNMVKQERMVESDECDMRKTKKR